MRIAARFILIVMLAGTSFLLSNCHKDKVTPSSKEKTQLTKLVTTWNLSSVTLDGAPRQDFTNVVLTVDGNYVSDGGTYNYSFTGTFPQPSPWPKSGQWQFGADPTSQIVRVDDNLDMNYTLSSNDTQLVITFTYAGTGFQGGRVSEVNGNWSFTFNKQ